VSPTAEPTPAPVMTVLDTAGGVAVAVGRNLLAVAVIVVVCVLIGWVLRFVIRRVVARIVRGAKSKANVDDTRAIDASPLAQVRVVQRTRTLGSILQNMTNIVLVIIALVLIIGVLAPGVLGSLTLLTAALGAGLGFGAQNIVKDVLNGMFLVAEDQVGIGDVVDLGPAVGVVEYVSVRITQVRDANGTLWYVRNGEITRIGNMSMGWARAIVDIALPSDVDVEHVEQALLDAAKALAKEPKWRTRIIDKPEMWGLESVSGETLVIRLVMNTRANAKDDVARELRMRLRAAVDALGVPLPALNSVTLAGYEAAQRVRGANPPRTRPLATTPPSNQPRWRLKRADPTAVAPDAEGQGTP